MGLNAGMALMSIVVATIFRAILVGENRKLDRLERGTSLTHGHDPDNGDDRALSRCSVREFRYLH